MSDNPLEDSAERDQLIRERAYALWEADGCPHGSDLIYWEQARVLVGMQQSEGAGQIPVPDIGDPSVILGQPVEEASIQENLGEFPDRFADQGDRALSPSLKTGRLPNDVRPNQLFHCRFARSVD